MIGRISNNRIKIFQIIGRIAALTTDQEIRKSSLEIEIQRFCMFITYLALISGAVLFVIGCVVTRFDNVVNQLVNCSSS